MLVAPAALLLVWLRAMRCGWTVLLYCWRHRYVELYSVSTLGCARGQPQGRCVDTTAQATGGDLSRISAINVFGTMPN